MTPAIHAAGTYKGSVSTLPGPWDRKGFLSVCSDPGEIVAGASDQRVH